MKAFEYINCLLEMEYKPLCSVCGKEMIFKGTIFYRGKAYCMDCRRNLKNDKTITESLSDNYRYRELVNLIHDVEEEIKEVQSKHVLQNYKMIKSRGKEMTVFQYNTMKKKEKLDYLKDKLKNLNDEYDTLLVQIKLKETL